MKKSLSKLIEYNMITMISKPSYHSSIVKRIMDIVLSVFFIILLSPILLVLSIIIYLNDGHSPFYAHIRKGKDGKDFKCLKFRTMVVNSKEALEKHLSENAEAKKEWKETQKLVNDPRITNIGKFIRKYSLDEVPQFFNVFIGDMSLVGPRPIVEEEIVKYGNFYDDFISIKPGLTGLWQISGRADLPYSTRVKIDKEYFEKANILMDLTIIFKTPFVVIFGIGAR